MRKLVEKSVMIVFLSVGEGNNANGFIYKLCVQIYRFQIVIRGTFVM